MASAGDAVNAEQPRSAERWPWVSAALAVVAFLDLVAVTVYLWGIPEEGFDNLEKVLSSVGAWLAAVAAAFGIRYKFRRGRPVREVFGMRPVRLGVIAATVVIWFFVLPVHSVTVATYAVDARGGQPTPLPEVKVKLGGRVRGVTEVGDDRSQATVTIPGLAARGQDVVLEREGFASESLSVSFVDVIRVTGRPVPAHLRAAKGYLTLTTRPSGAAVYLDRDSSSAYGTTPTTLFVDAGQHWVKFEKQGGFLPTVWQPVTVPPGDTAPLERTLQLRQVQRYRITIRSIPAGAEIFINDESDSWGATPRTVELPRGRHTIRLVKDGYAPGGGEIRVTRHMPITYRLQERSGQQ